MPENVVPVYGPFVTGAVSFISIAMSLYTAKKAVRHEREIKMLEDRLAFARAERDARRDYEYEARKRLYEECEPLFFQMREAAENALHRVFSLARTAREGHLGPGSDDWMEEGSYYALSTYYKLLLPLAFHKLIQRRLTLVDLTVEPIVRARYELTKWMYVAFTSDFELSKIPPSISYNPNDPTAERRRKRNPRMYWRQGFFYGLLDNVIEALLVVEGTGQTRCMSFGEFENALNSPESSIRKAFPIVEEVFCEFHPHSRPVLWRILIVEAHLYAAILEASKPGNPAPEGEFRPLGLFSADDRQRLDWRSNDREGSPEEVAEPFVLAQRYLETHLPGLLCRER